MTVAGNQESRDPQRILLAEDNEAVRNVFAVTLENAGYVVDAAEDGAVALEFYRKMPDDYDVLITDHEMPCLTGLQLVEKLRTSRFAGKIIVLSGGLTSSSAAAFMDLQVDQILSKPQTCANLIKVIKAL